MSDVELRRSKLVNMKFNLFCHKKQRFCEPHLCGHISRTHYDKELNVSFYECRKTGIELMALMAKKQVHWYYKHPEMSWILIHIF